MKRRKINVKALKTAAKAIAKAQGFLDSARELRERADAGDLALRHASTVLENQAEEQLDHARGMWEDSRGNYARAGNLFSLYRTQEQPPAILSR